MNLDSNNSVTDINVGNLNFQSMPKRFIAWDKYRNDWVTKFLMSSTDDKESDDWTCPLTLGINSKGEKDWLNNDQLIICQSTGLFDKDGKEIFEGSIVENGHRWRGIIVGYKGQWVVNYKIPTPEMWHLLYDIKNCIKNIGHILSNPELLEDENV